MKVNSLPTRNLPFHALIHIKMGLNPFLEQSSTVNFLNYLSRLGGVEINIAYPRLFGAKNTEVKIMRILGIDPGYAIVGIGVIESIGIKYKPLACGVITTPAKIPIEDRLSMIYDKLTALIKKYKPEAAAVEELFFNTNHTTAIPVAEARGVILLCLKQNGIPIYEYTPLQVKQAVVGYGRAEKQQVIAMTTSLLQLPKPPKPDDAADALAIAICHANIGGSGLAAYYNKR